MTPVTLSPEAKAALDDLNGILTALFDIEEQFENFPTKHRIITQITMSGDGVEFADSIRECQFRCRDVYCEIIESNYRSADRQRGLGSRNPASSCLDSCIEAREI